ncbi:MAG: DUF4118 domain-containing protein [Vicinamibacterales bacterium]
MQAWLRAPWRSTAAGLTAVALVTVGLLRWLPAANAATVSTSYLLVVLIVAATSRLWVAVTTSLAAVLCFNFFFLPPVGTLTIADPQNWVALVSFLAVSLVASNLSSRARLREQDARLRRDEMARLFDLSRDVLVITGERSSMDLLARSIARRFDLAFAAIALPAENGWDVFRGGPNPVNLDDAVLSRTLASARTTLEFDARERAYAGQTEVRCDGQGVRLIPLRSGQTPIGLLAASGRAVDPATMDMLAGLSALAVERARLLQEQKAAEMTRRSEELKAALLASLGHDLRTPLTAIRIAASNVRDGSLPATEREEQAALIQSEVERLARLFHNILEMARIDAGAVSAQSRWVHPSEIVEAARAMVDDALAGHPLVAEESTNATTVELDPRLTSAALSHILENAAQYAPDGTSVDVTTEVAPSGLTIRVRDHGPGVAASDLPRLFDRFYRGDSGHTRPSGTGMGLWIARQLLAVQQGRIWVENAPEGGAVFSLFVPAPSKATTQITDEAT